jgi:eukaryotic-like serine/threonine-protein kinase
MSQSSTERNLLFGTLALKLDFITLEALITAMKTCASEKDKPIGQVLQSQGSLAKDDDGLLDSLVHRFMAIHDNNARRCLAAVTTVNAIRHDLDEIGDPDLSLTLDFVAKSEEETAQGPDGTVPHAAGTACCGAARFRLLKFHKKGGLGEVWVARDIELNREVALKQIQAQHADDPQCQTRFLHEAEVTGRLEHRGIVPVYGLGHFENGRPYYAMRFVSGTSLKDAIDAFHEAKASDHASIDRSLELRRLLSRFVDVCNTVAYAHSRGVLHRDLKPGNIILDEYGETLVVDWGLAKTGAVDLEAASDGGTRPPVSTSNTPDTRAGTKMGTPGFMSPEQELGRLSELSPASDVYSLGATLYYLLTGKAAFNEPDPSLITFKVCAGDFPRLREVDSTVPVALAAICLKAMALAPKGRYSSPRDLGDEIERWLADQPVLAYPEPLPARAMRWVRRRKQWVAAAAVLLVLTVLGLAITNWRITQEQGRTTASNRRIIQEQARTTDQLAMTRNALRELLTVSGENLAFLPNTEKLREHLAQLVLDRYQHLGDKFPIDPGVRLETAQVHRVLGGLSRLTGQFAKSQASYERAIEGLTTLCKNDPGHEEYRRWLVETYIDRGELNHMNSRTIDAEKDFHAAIDHAGKLQSAAISPDYRRTMASALINLSEVLVLKDEHGEAHTAADHAVDLLRPLANPEAASDRTTRDRWLLSMALTDRGVASKGAGDRDRATHDFDEAARVSGSIAEDDPIYDDSQDQLACIANQRGELLSMDDSKLPESESTYEQADKILSRLVDKHKIMPLYREQMVATLCGRSTVRIAMKRIPDAQRDCEAAQGHLTWLIGEQTRKGAPENPQYLSLLGQVLAQQSRIHFIQRRPAEGRSTRALAVAKLSRAIQLDPARAADKARLEQIKAGPAQSEE